MLKNKLSNTRIAVLALITVLTVLVFLFFLYLSDNAINQLPNVKQLNYNYASKSEPLKISYMQKLSERVSLSKITFCSELEESSVKEETVVPVLTNEYYFEIYRYSLNGSGITKEMVNHKEKKAVIGSDLAIKLFFNTDVVGKTITINDEAYTVCGVYEQSNSLINSISSDGKNRIFIPYTCYEGNEACELSIIACDNAAMYAAVVEQINLQSYYLTDFSEKSNAIICFRHVLFFVIFVVLCIIALKIWYWLCRKLYSDIRRVMKDNYLKQAIRKKPIKFILLILTAVGIPVLLLILFFISDFSFYIVPKYIPDDNIFDIPHYVDMIIGNSNIMNSLALTGDTYLLNLYSKTFNILPWLTAIFLIIFFVLLYMVVESTKKIITKKN